MMKSNLQKQRGWVKAYRQVKMPCPNCAMPFAMWDAHVPTNDGKPDMAKCPSCGLYFVDCLGFDGSRWWSAMRDIERIKD
jgi:hypothetical protein